MGPWFPVYFLCIYIDFLCISIDFLCIVCILCCTGDQYSFSLCTCCVRIIYDFMYQWLSGPHGEPGTWAQDMIIECSWLSALQQREKTQRGTSQTPQTQQGIVQGNKLLYLTFTYSNAFFEPQWGVLAFCQAWIWPFFKSLLLFWWNEYREALSKSWFLFYISPCPGKLII